MPSDTTGHRPIRLERREAVQTGVGALAVLGGLLDVPVTAAQRGATADEHLPDPAQELDQAMADLEGLAATAPEALVVDFRRERLAALQQHVSGADAQALVDGAQEHNEEAAEALVAGDPYQLETALDETAARLRDLRDGAGDKTIVTEPIPVPHTVTVRREAADVSADYELEVAQAIVPGPEFTNEETVVEGRVSRTAAGSVGPDTYEEWYWFDGELVDVEIDGPATLFVNGEPVDPDAVTETVRVDHTATVRRQSEAVSADYVLEAAEGLIRGPELVGPDTVVHGGVQTTARGTVGPDTYEEWFWFDGTFTNVTLDGPAELYVNGELISTASVDRVVAVPHTLTVRRETETERADYELEAKHGIVPGPELAGGPTTVTGDVPTSAAGTVGPDTYEEWYRFDGELAAVDIDGPATLFIDGQPVDPAAVVDRPREPARLPTGASPLVDELLAVQEEPFNEVFGSPSEITLRLLGFDDPRVERTETGTGDIRDRQVLEIVDELFGLSDLGIDLTGLSRVSQLDTTLAVMLETEAQLDRTATLIDEVEAAGHEVSLAEGEPAELLVSGTPLTRVDPATVHWLAAYGTTRTSVVAMLGTWASYRLATFDAPSISDAFIDIENLDVRSYLQAHTDLPAQVIGWITSSWDFLKGRFAEDDDSVFWLSGHLGGMLALGPALALQLNGMDDDAITVVRGMDAEVDPPVDDLDTLWRWTSRIDTVVPSLRYLEDYLTQDITDVDEHVLDQIEDETGRDLREDRAAIEAWLNEIIDTALEVDPVTERVPPPVLHMIRDITEADLTG